MRKTIKNLVLGMALMVSTLVAAQSTEDIESKLKNVPFPVEENIDAKAYIKLNSENRIVFARVNSENEQINNFIRTRLINSIVKSDSLETNKTYVIPVKVLSLEK